MDSSKLKIITLNAHRIGRLSKILKLNEIISRENAHFIHIQEIVVSSAIKVFSQEYQVLINYEQGAEDNDGVGIITLVAKRLNISDFIIGEKGRTIGVKAQDVQTWHCYPKSGSENKKWRESYFRETLPNLMVSWKDHTSMVSQAGDHNCTIRENDSENNKKQHLQPALVEHLKVFDMKDEYIRLRGNETPVSFSRVTNRSKTRIDIIASNSTKCTSFQYKEMGEGYDHKMAIATYDINMQVGREQITRQMRYSSWVIPKELCEDTEFNEKVGEICDHLEEEITYLEEANYPVDYTKYWKIMKEKITKVAKQREKEIKYLENGRKNALNGFLELVMDRLERGEDAWEDFNRLRKELSEIWQVKIQRKISVLKSKEMDDNMYDIHKLQKQKKYENKGKIEELSIDGKNYNGTKEILQGLHEKLTEDLGQGSVRIEEPPTEEEIRFLDLLPKLELTDEEIKQLEGPVSEEECEEIFKELDLDSSPGNDGITYRMMAHLYRRNLFYKIIFLNTIEWTRVNQDLGHLNDFAVMKLLNKKRPTSNYEGKRKLTLNNKDVGFVGKVWTNRFMKMVLTRILPKQQFICQEDLNIVDENIEIRDIVRHLRGDDDGIEKNGTVIAIDYKDAFRSTYHRWVKLVLEHVNIPALFGKWFWSMYKNLSLIVTLNGQKSEKIQQLRGLAEGHSASMPVFALAVAPILVAIENSITGIVTLDGKRHKSKGFADDAKAFLDNPREIYTIYDIIKVFEQISGLYMHRDPARKKCQALTFGEHREYDNWPIWVTLASEIKVVGILYTNDRGKSLEEINSNLVKEKVENQLFSAYGARGTVKQKIEFVNTYIYSKIWYTAQSINLDKDILKEMDRKVRNFIHAGENERPVQALVYREKEYGGLGLICAATKSRAFLVKSMYRSWMKLVVQAGSEEISLDSLYGIKEDLKMILEDEQEHCKSVRNMYHCLLEKKIKKRESWIPSRAEKKNPGVKFRRVWENQLEIKKVSPQLKYFGWCLGQDMVVVGARKNRANQRKECQQMIEDELTGELQLCEQRETLKHALVECQVSRAKFEWLKNMVQNHMQNVITDEQIIFMSFTNRNKKKNRTILWVVVHSLYFIWSKREATVEDLRNHLKEEMFFHQTLERWVGDRNTFNSVWESLRH